MNRRGRVAKRADLRNYAVALLWRHVWCARRRMAEHRCRRLCGGHDGARQGSARRRAGGPGRRLLALELQEGARGQRRVDGVPRRAAAAVAVLARDLARTRAEYTGSWRGHLVVEDLVHGRLLCDGARLREPGARARDGGEGAHACAGACHRMGGGGGSARRSGPTPRRRGGEARAHSGGAKVVEHALRAVEELLIHAHFARFLDGRGDPELLPRLHGHLELVGGERPSLRVPRRSRRQPVRLVRELQGHDARGHHLRAADNGHTSHVKHALAHVAEAAARHDIVCLKEEAVLDAKLVHGKLQEERHVVPRLKGASLRAHMAGHRLVSDEAQ
mmetsp:Transcript_7151/g.20725  ORF Transcript_7151/g.20725 Transcript_7151/m.20725 type:complete len:332 (+) Transcript_7151:197-1192(+)